jgi:hypothetical protein
MDVARVNMRRVSWLAFLVCFLISPAASSGQNPVTAKDAPSSTGASQKPEDLFTRPVLVKNSPTNLRYFDVSWNDNATQRYYLADRTNNAIDVIDSATNTFLGFIGKGRFTGARPCPGQPHEMRLCAGPNGVVTDNFGHIWSGDGDGNIVEAYAKPGSEIIRKIPTGGAGRLDELAYDPVDHILMAENDGSFPPYVIFLSVPSAKVIGRHVYPKGQMGMEQPAWVRATDLFYQNVPGPRNRLDVYDPHHLPNPVKSFPVDCAGGLLGLTLSGLTAGPNAQLMTVCGSVGGVTVDARTGKVGKPIPEGGDADEVSYDPGSNCYYFSGEKGVAVVNAKTEKFIEYVPLPSHSVAANEKNKHVFVPVAGRGIFVFAQRR